MEACQRFSMEFVARWSKFLSEIDKFSQAFKKKSNDDESQKKSQRIRKDFCEVEHKNKEELRSLELEAVDNTKESLQPKNNASPPIILQENILNKEYLSSHNGSPLMDDSPVLLSESLEKDEKKSKFEAAPMQKKKKLIKLKEKENNELKEREDKIQEEKESEEWLIKKKIKKEKRKKKLLDTDDSDLDFKIKKKAK